MSEYGNGGVGAFLWKGLQWFGSLFGLGGVSSEVRNTIRWIKSRLVDLIGTVARGLARFGLLMKKVGQLFQKLWTGILRPAIARIFGWVQKLSALLKKWLDPIIKWLRRIRDEILKFYEKFIRPILDAIDVARRILRIASLLGLDWAKKLEEKLAKVQTAISAPFLQVVAKLNEAIGWINKIITLDGLFQRFTLFRSLWVYRRDFVNFTTNTLFRPATKEEKDGVTNPPGPTSPEIRIGELVRVARGDDQLVNAKAREWVIDVARLLR